MTATTPVERVADMLNTAEFRRIDGALNISGLKFEFPAIFVGTGMSPDLIVVADTAFEGEGRILQKVEGLARALDAVQSRRPLTVVITGPRPRGPIANGLSRVCRVLPADDAADAGILRNALAVLLPLNLPEPKDDLTDVGDMLALTSDMPPDEMTTALVLAAREGEDTVRECFHASIAEPFSEPETDMEVGA